MRIVRRFIYNLESRLEHSKLQRVPLDIDYQCKYSIEYVSQWESSNLNKQISLGKISASEDPLWQLSGADSQDEYKLWSWNICALACFKMVSKNFGGQVKEIKLISFAKELIHYQAYTLSNNVVNGVFWDKFSLFLLKKFKIKSKLLNPLTIPNLISLLFNNQIVLISVTPDINTNLVKGEDKSFLGGHVVIVHGFKREKGEVRGFYIKDPAGWQENMTQEFFINRSEFLKNYAGRGFQIFR